MILSTGCSKGQQACSVRYHDAEQILLLVTFVCTDYRNARYKKEIQPNGTMMSSPFRHLGSLAAWYNSVHVHPKDHFSKISKVIRQTEIRQILSSTVKLLYKDLMGGFEGDLLGWTKNFTTAKSRIRVDLGTSSTQNHSVFTNGKKTNFDARVESVTCSLSSAEKLWALESNKPFRAKIPICCWQDLQRVLLTWPTSARLPLAFWIAKHGHVAVIAKPNRKSHMNIVQPIHSDGCDNNGKNNRQ